MSRRQARTLPAISFSRRSISAVRELCAAGVSRLRRERGGPNGSSHRTTPPEGLCRILCQVAPVPFARLFSITGRRAVESVVPRRTFDDVILPPATRRALDNALAHVTQHDLIFNRWGFAERHPLASRSRSISPARQAPGKRFAPKLSRTRSVGGCCWSGTRNLNHSGWAKRRKTWPPSSRPHAKKVPCCCSTKRTRLPRGDRLRSITGSSESRIRW